MRKSFTHQTKRLVIRTATIEDVSLFYRLWMHPEVMTNVGFPQGIPITQAEIKEKIDQQGESVFSQLLVVTLKIVGEAIGECKMHAPDQAGIAQTDVKLLPSHWGHKYGVEVKRALLNYLFTQTDCVAVQATPNVKNTASIKMQEAVGGRCMGKGITEFPESMEAYTIPVQYYIYQVFREDWQQSQC